MSQIIDLIKQLRNRTGAGMMDCKRALESNDLDIDKAIDWLREKGITKAASRSSRIAAEGITHILGSDHEKVILEVNCETDFVARGDTFIKLVNDIATVLLKEKPADLEAAQLLAAPLINEVTLKIGEKVALRRYEIVASKDGQVLGTYIHMNGKISSIAVMEGVNVAFADNMAMHITANSPVFINKEAIPSETYDHEAKIQREISLSDEKLKDKPLPALEKIIAGKVAKVFKEQTLSEQPYLIDESGTLVGIVLDKVKGKVTHFVRYAVGEGIEKRSDNFAQEVMDQIK